MEETTPYISRQFIVPVVKELWRNLRVSDSLQAERLWWRVVVERSSVHDSGLGLRRRGRSTGPAARRITDRRQSVQLETQSTTRKSDQCRRGIAGKQLTARVQSHKRSKDLD
jgi:hypothetical protein